MISNIYFEISKSSRIIQGPKIKILIKIDISLGKKLNVCSFICVAACKILIIRPTIRLGKIIATTSTTTKNKARLKISMVISESYNPKVLLIKHHNLKLNYLSP